MAWRATIIYLVCCFGGLPFVADRRPEVRFNAWQSILYDGVTFLLYFLAAVPAEMLGLTSSGSDTSAQPQDLDVFASVFLWIYYGGRFLLMVMTWWGKHLRLPLIGRFAEALAMRRY